MSYLVDGNNVMAQRPGWHRDRAGARRRLMDELADYARARRVSLAVVFDGAPEDHFGDGATYRGVRVYYAARGSDADARIKAMVEGSRERRTLRVVTSDRALADYVRRCGAGVVRAGEFRREMERVVAAKKDETRGADERESAVVEDEAKLKQWMRYFGVDEGDG